MQIFLKNRHVLKKRLEAVYETPLSCSLLLANYWEKVEGGWEGTPPTLARHSVWLFSKHYGMFYPQFALKETASENLSNGLFKVTPPITDRVGIPYHDHYGIPTLSLCTIDLILIF